MNKMIWPYNIKNDINDIHKFSIELEKYLYSINNKTLYNKVHHSIISQFNESLKTLVKIFISNFEEDKFKYVSFMYNIEGVFIFLRKMIEAMTIINIIVNSKDKEIYEGYINQQTIDEANIKKMFNGTSKHFNKTITELKNKYSYLNKLTDKEIKSIDDLIDLAHITKLSKSYFKSWIEECNYMSHPNLYSEHLVKEALSEDILFTLRYIFEIVEQMIYSIYYLIEEFERTPLFKSNYNTNDLKELIPDFSVFHDEFFNIKLKKEEQTLNIDNFNNIPYNLLSELQFLNIGVTSEFSNNSLTVNKKRTLGKLIDVLAFNVKDLLMGFYGKNNILFYAKIRQVLENITYINKMLSANELEVEVFQYFTDLQRYHKTNNITRQFKDYNNINKTFRTIKINTEKGLITLERHYQYVLIFLKEYYKKIFNINVTTNFLKRPNSWASDGKKTISNWALIKQSLKDKNIDYFKGLYSLSSLFCHINHFSVNNEIINTDGFYIEILKEIMLLVKETFDKLLTYTSKDLINIFNKTELTINKILFNLYNYDIIKVPNPY